MNAVRLAALSGTSSMVASQDTSRSPDRNAPPPPPRLASRVAARTVRPTAPPHPATGLRQPRRRRWGGLVALAVRQLPPHAAIPLPWNRVNARTNHATTREGNRRTRRWTAPVSANTSIDQGDRDVLRQYPN